MLTRRRLARRNDRGHRRAQSGASTLPPVARSSLSSCRAARVDEVVA